MQARFTNPWWVVVGSVTGLLVCNGPVMGFTFGVFLKPIMADMGWQRSTASFAMTLGPAIGALCVPFLGRMMDRWGIRQVALPGIVLFASCLCLLGFSPHSLWIFTMLFAFAAISSEIQTPLGYTKAISAWFDRRRGLALGVALAGVGLGGFFVPQLAQWLILNFGWRNAYIGLGLLTLAVAFPAVALFVREPRPDEGERGSAGARHQLTGFTVFEAARTARFWLLCATFFLVATALLGSSGHVVPLLTDRGVSPTAAAAMMGLFGLATLAGRVLAGYLVDRIFAPYVATVFFLAPIAGFALIVSAAGTLPAIGVILIGLGLGTEVDLMAFLITRYFGQRSFGQIYGCFFMMFGLGGDAGRFLGGYIFDLAGSYTPALIGAAVGLVGAVILINRLGAYRYPVHHAIEAELAPLPAAS
jgi:predicted MFS family arabinose efflux permease